MTHSAGGVDGQEWAEIRVRNMPAVVVDGMMRRDRSSQLLHVRMIGFRIVCEAPIERSLQAMTVEHSLVVLRGCSMSCSSGPTVGVISSHGRLIAEDCLVYDGAQGGVLVAEEGTISLTKVQICYNAACGLELRTAGSASMENCNIFENGRQGIMIWNEAGNLKATRCEVHSHGMESGILVGENNPATAEFQECKIHSNSFAGIAVQRKGRAKIVECSISGNNSGILLQESGHAVIENCDIFENTGNGIFVGYDHTGKATVANNHLHGNMYKGIFLGTTGDQNCRVRVTGNREHDNRGLPPMPPKHVQQRGLNGPQKNSALDPRRWAKRVQKSQGKKSKHISSGVVAQEENHRQAAAPPKTAFEEAFDKISVESTSAIVETLLGCGFCQKTPEAGVRLLKCSKCLTIEYCSRDCQRKHWKAGHKRVCSPPISKTPSFINPHMSV